MSLKLIKIGFIAGATVVTFAAGVGVGALTVAYAMSVAVKTEKANEDDDIKSDGWNSDWEKHLKGTKA